MIVKQEIIDFAREFSLPVNTIEKDYVLGWLLAGIEEEWSNMLSHQVPMLPPKEQFWQVLPKMFAWLHNN